MADTDVLARLEALVSPFGVVAEAHPLGPPRGLDEASRSMAYFGDGSPHPTGGARQSHRPGRPQPARTAGGMAFDDAAQAHLIAIAEAAERYSASDFSEPVVRAADSRDLLSYEWRMGRASLSLEPESVPTPAQRVRLAALQLKREFFPSAPRYSLPGQTRVQPVEPAGCLNESVLAGILARTAGIRAPGDNDAGAAHSRWTPSGGNMASVALYLGTETEPFGLPGTIFRVMGVRAERVPLALILDGTDLDAARTDVAFVFVSDVGRLRQKYSAFAWRLTHLDAGCAALQLHLTAAGYGLRTVFASTWPAQLAELLELDSRREVVTAVAAVSASPDLRREGSSPCR